MEEETYIYDIYTTVSAHTNRPVYNIDSVEKSPVFWCGVCQIQLCSGPHCWQHMQGALHKLRQQKVANGELVYIRHENGNGSQHTPKKRRQNYDSIIMPVENPAYGPDTVISIHTNRPKMSGEEQDEEGPVFWCGICNLRLSSGPHCWQHMTGRLHKIKEIRKYGGNGKFTDLKYGGGDGGIFREPPPKKSKQIPGALFVSF